MSASFPTKSEEAKALLLKNEEELERIKRDALFRRREMRARFLHGFFEYFFKPFLWILAIGGMIASCGFAIYFDFCTSFHGHILVGVLMVPFALAGSIGLARYLSGLR
jgi:hypothetical protein